MNEGPSILKNAASVVGARILAKAVWVVVTFQVARYLGETRLGDYARIMAYVVFFEGLATLGLQFLLQREIAARPSEAPELLGGAVALWTRTAVACPFVAVLCSHLVGDPRELTMGLAAASLGLLLWGAGSLYNAVLVAQERLPRVAASEALTALLRSALCVGVIVARWPMIAFFAAYTLSNVLYCVLSYAWCPIRARRPLGADLMPLFHRALPFGTMIVASGLYFRADTWILWQLKGAAETGRYEAAYRPVNMVMDLGYLVAWSWFPRMAALFAKDPQGYRRVARTAFLTLLAVGVAAAAIGSGFAAPLIHLCYGGRFDLSAPLLRRVALGVAFYFPACALMYAVVASGRTWFWAALLGGKAALSIAVNLVLVPTRGAHGTAMAMVICEGAGLLFCAVGWAWRPRR